MTSFRPKVPSKPQSFSIVVPGVSPEADLVAEQLLTKNNKEFHCFNNDRKFHNHLIHHLLAAYSLGARKEKIQEIFDKHAEIQRPLPPSIGELTRANYKDQLGNAAAYTSFLTLFQFEVEKYGVVDTVRRWIWSGDMLARLVGGAYHPLIHVGYGLEFDIPGTVAEGLAMTACTESHYSGLVPRLPDLDSSALLPTQAQVYAENASSTAKGYMSSIVNSLSQQISSRLGINDKTETPATPDRSAKDEASDSLPPYLQENTLFPIFNQIRKDPVFDNQFTSSDNVKFKILLNNQKTVERIQHYVNQWELEENSKSIQEKFKELYTLTTVALGSAGMRKDHPGILRLDFFLMHAVTSSEFVHQYIYKVAPSEAVSLLKAHLSATIIHYITAGSPDFYIDGLLGYKSPIQDGESNNHWLRVFDKALACKEPHVIKVVRSCAVAQIIYGPHQDTHLNAVWLQVAQMSIDKDGDWDFSGVGFDDTWGDSHVSNSESKI